MDKAYYLLGAGGHARVVLDALLVNHFNVVGILVPEVSNTTQLLGVPVWEEQSRWDSIACDNTRLVNGLGANPQVIHRRAIFEKMKALGFFFESVKHPSSIISSDVMLGEGTQFMAGTVIQTGCNIGDNVVINTRASIDHNCVIAKHAFISPGAILCGDVKVQEAAFVGAGAIVLPGIEIGSFAIIGAGAVVTKSIPHGCKVAGNPARPMESHLDA